MKDHPEYKYRPRRKPKTLQKNGYTFPLPYLPSSALDPFNPLHQTFISNPSGQSPFDIASADKTKQTEGSGSENATAQSSSSTAAANIFNYQGAGGSSSAAAAAAASQYPWFGSAAASSVSSSSPTTTFSSSVSPYESKLTPSDTTASPLHYPGAVAAAAGGNISPPASMPTPSPEAKPDIAAMTPPTSAAAVSAHSPSSLNSFYNSFYTKSAAAAAAAAGLPSMAPNPAMVAATSQAAAMHGLPSFSAYAAAANPAAAAAAAAAANPTNYPLTSLELRRPVGVLI